MLTILECPLAREMWLDANYHLVTNTGRRLATGERQRIDPSSAAARENNKTIRIGPNTQWIQSLTTAACSSCSADSEEGRLWREIATAATERTTTAHRSLEHEYRV